MPTMIKHTSWTSWRIMPDGDAAKKFLVQWMRDNRPELEKFDDDMIYSLAFEDGVWEEEDAYYPEPIKYWSFTTDCIDEEELRDSARDGGCPTEIDIRLWPTKEQAVAEMLKEINDAIEDWFDDTGDELHPGTLTADNLIDGKYTNTEVGQEWRLVEYTVQS
jgi:hypothetical protein